MANLLMINVVIPWPLKDGNALRVYELARHLGPEHRCHLACFGDDTDRAAELAEKGAFASITLLPPVPRRRHWSRFFRRDDRDFHRLSYPQHFRQVVGSLQEIVDREEVDTVVSVLLRTEEFGRALQGARRVVDEYDCLTIAIERELAARRDLGTMQRLRLWLQLRRARAAEAALAGNCDLITAIAPPDVAKLRRLTRDRVPVELVPNGVDEMLLAREAPEGEQKRAVAFWGNLAFPVNQLAAEWFYREVWLPHLQAKEVGLTIVGPNAPESILELARRHPEITVPGYVDDLFAYLDSYPVMVNPMVSGTGLKNKALEALAVGKAVVSTPLGMEAFPVIDGEHCLLAGDPECFATAVLRLLEEPQERRRLAAQARTMAAERYSWDAVAARWGRILFQSGADQSA